VHCENCGSDWPEGVRFCGNCGASLERSCAECGAPTLTADQRFCASCGAPLGGASSSTPAASVASGQANNGGEQAGERRLVSVLFADLVGFTPFSESRDAETVREVLEEYFELCSDAIESHGGTVEKFIGDAVMAVWGSPQAKEDDAERTVRAGLEIATDVALLGQRIGVELRARAGVVTGEAAVRIGAGDTAMVIGDAVNTAARLQSVAAPGTVLVDEATRRASQAAIAFEDGGEQELKGKAEPVQTFTALRVVANVGGVARTSGPEAPLVGRERERDAVIRAFERTAEGGGASMVLALAEPGLGKSRLAWEFEKYTDGISEFYFWHRGRSLSYGEGVAFWALAEMVRTRARITENEEPDEARAKLAETVARHVPDPGERRLVEPRLAALLGLARRPASDRADLFSGWRLFFERLTDESPVVMVFEDLHRADSGLLDFIDYLLEWSAERPIFILALARPEIGERRPEWTNGERPRVTPIPLGRLDDPSMDQLLVGLLPDTQAASVRSKIRDRAEGVPLYAVEIVRMLADRGTLERRGEHYELSGPVEEIEMPETLHALIAARLDDLSVDERRLLQDAAVLGLSFTAAGVAAVSERPIAEVETALERLSARQLIALNDDPFSPEKGQYRFLQGLVQRVAYSTLSRRDRKQRHLRAAEHLKQAFAEEGEEIAGCSRRTISTPPRPTPTPTMPAPSWPGRGRR
jgi:class 3 adenylate cyclase